MASVTIQVHAFASAAGVRPSDYITFEWDEKAEGDEALRASVRIIVQRSPDTFVAARSLQGVASSFTLVNSDGCPAPMEQLQRILALAAAPPG